jgi:F0F1-type ATP synthase beta subunit
MECLEALNEEERQVIETLYEVIEKCIRLTANLSEEEKAIVKKYNRVVRFFGSSMMMNGAEKGGWEGHTKEELEELRVLYEGIMAEQGERIYE